MKIIIQSILTLLLTVPLVYACRGVENQPKDSFEEAFKNAPIAFIGTIVSAADPKDGVRIVSFKIEHALKKISIEKLWFKLQTGRSCDLGKYAETGSRWIILAEKVGDKIFTASHSRRLFDKSEESSILMKLNK